jgi:hypothetical protein
MDLQKMTDVCLFIFCKLTLQLLSSSALTEKNFRRKQNKMIKLKEKN